MLENMFIGQPPGNYDRLLDFSRAVTGGLFFVPSASFLDNLSAEGPVSAALGTSAASDPPAVAGGRETSLGIGSLKGEKDE
jgi:putative iron-dependent peroxidase